MDDDTILIIMGDHGMNVGGGHGDSGPHSTESVIFGYRKNGFNNLRNEFPELY